MECFIKHVCHLLRGVIVRPLQPPDGKAQDRTDDDLGGYFRRRVKISVDAPVLDILHGFRDHVFVDAMGHLGGAPAAEDHAIDVAILFDVVEDIPVAVVLGLGWDGPAELLFDLLLGCVDHSGDQRPQQFILVPGVQIEGGPGQVGAVGNILDGYRIVSLFQDRFDQCGLQLFQGAQAVTLVASERGSVHGYTPV